MNSEKNNVLANFVWRFAERCGAQLVTFLVSVVLARILSPEDYGQVALITVFTTIMQVFVDSGLGTALIQKKNADDLDFSSVFYFNFAVCILLYAVMFVAAPFIATFYNDESLTSIIRVISLTIVVSGIKGIQQSYVSRNMLFKRFFYATLGGTILSAFLGIALAYIGCGVWAIVAQQLSNTIIDTLILWLTVKWRPKKQFSWQRLKGLLSFGWKMLVSSLLDTVYNNVRSLIIGKMYSSSDLAYYNQGKQFPNVIVTNINTSIDSVLLPTMSSAQDDCVRVKSMTRRAIKTSTYIMAPLMMGLAFCANPIVQLVLTDKWLPCVPFLQIFCITYMFYPIHTANLNAIKAMGRSDMFLKLEIAKKVVGMVLLFITMWFGVMAMAYSLLVSSVLSQVINSWPNRKLLRYGYLEQLKDISPSIILAVVMGFCVKAVEMIEMPIAVTLVIQIPFGALIYVGLSFVLHLESFEYIMDTIRLIFAKREEKEMKEKKKLLLLGGSAQQVIAIKTAKRLGYYTVLCDFLTDNPGQYEADKFYLVSTTDKDAVLDVAQKEKISGVLAYASDPAAPTAAYLAEKMCFPGNPYQSVEILCNKDRFRNFLLENGFSAPKAKGYASADTAMEEKESFEYPIIIKPVDSSGSKGATVLHSEEGLTEALEFAFSFSRCHRIIIEHFIEKKHPYLIGGDIFIENGKIILWGLMNCHRDNCVNPLVPVGKSYPLQLEVEDVQRVKETLSSMVEKLEIRNGSMNVELVVDKSNQVWPIDVGPRSGGNMIPDLLGDMFGVDIAEMSVEAAIGTPIKCNIHKPNGFYATHNLHSNRNGIYKDILFSAEIEPYIYRKCLYKKQGDMVEYFDNAAKCLGIVFLKFPNEEIMVDTLRRVNELITVELE